MKRVLSILLAVMMVMGCIGAMALADGETLVYASDFTKDEDGWYGRGAQSFRTKDGTLRTEGRTSDWNSPGRDFELVADNLYELSVEVYQDELDSAAFMISVAHSTGGVETYENLAHGTVKKGEWTTVKGSYTPGEYEKYVLYVETSNGAGELSFEIRNFRVESPNGVPTPKATEPPMEIEAVENLPSLKEIYAGKFDFGVAAPSSAFRDINLMKMMKEQYSILTPENELKPDAVLDTYASKKLVEETGDETAVAVHFDSAKALLRFAQSNGIKVHGHVLVWHNQTPETFFHEGYDAKKPLLTREVMLGRLENYIKEVLTQSEEQYPGVIVSWDVVNEAIDDSTNWLRKGSTWYKVVGEDFVARAFEYARKYAADGVLLYYNDYNTAYSGKLYGIIKLLNTLIPEGNIDGYGFQMHHSSGQPSTALITTAVEKIAALGLKLRVSEMDIGIASRTETSYKAQARKYAEMMQLMLRFADQTEAVQVWGLTDKMSWRSKDYPLLFDGNMNPKPAFYAVAYPDQPDKWE